MKLSEIVKKVINLREAINNYWDIELPKRHRDYPIVHEGEDSGPPPPEQKKLQEFLASLPEDMLYQLALIADLGRGIIGSRDLAEGYKKVKDRFEHAEESASLLAVRISLADALSDGLDELKKNNIDVDRMLSKPARSRK
jgi:hypothetical protein